MYLKPKKSIPFCLSVCCIGKDLSALSVPVPRLWHVSVALKYPWCPLSRCTSCNNCSEPLLDKTFSSSRLSVLCWDFLVWSRDNSGMVFYSCNFCSDFIVFLCFLLIFLSAQANGSVLSYVLERYSFNIKLRKHCFVTSVLMYKLAAFCPQIVLECPCISYVILLCGDITLNLGPIQWPCIHGV